MLARGLQRDIWTIKPTVLAEFVPVWLNVRSDCGERVGNRISRLVPLITGVEFADAITDGRSVNYG